MQFRHLVVATDQTDAARAAENAALDIAKRTGAQVSVLYVASAIAQRPVDVGAEIAPIPPYRDALEHAREDLHAWWVTGHPRHRAPSNGRIQWVVGAGLPSVEISRFAEDHRADLIILTRKRHSRLRRMLLGDTADSVVRRSPVPCLFVPTDGFDESRVVAAVDGSDRGLAVVHAAMRFAGAMGGQLSFVTVERTREDEPADLVEAVPGSRSVLLGQDLERIAVEEGQLTNQVIRGGHMTSALHVRHGGPVAEILQEVADRGAGVLVIGYHRGGPPGPVESGSVARQLAHRTPCAVLTIPL